jgi:hypothetical protein
MNVSRPEADIEYSRGGRASDGDFDPSKSAFRGGSGARSGGSDAHRATPSPRSRTAVLGGGLAGAALLLVAEFAPLYTVHTSARHGTVQMITTGSHHAYALVPIALLAAALTVAWWRSPSRPALAAVGLLALVALVIAIGRDLPDAHASGLIRDADGAYVSAVSRAGIGFYLETLGAVILLVTSAAGQLMAPRTPHTPNWPISIRRRSAS